VVVSLSLIKFEVHFLMTYINSYAYIFNLIAYFNEMLFTVLLSVLPYGCFIHFNTFSVMVIMVLSVSFSHDVGDCTSTIFTLKRHLTKTNCNISVNFSMFYSVLLLVLVIITRIL
jgi:hypothetical protein